MDLSKLDTRKGAEQGFALTILTPAGDKTDIVITVRGSDSPVYQQKYTEIRRRWTNQINRERRLARTVDEQDADDLDLLVISTVSWAGIELDGAAFPFSEANARKLYTDFPAIREQVDRAVNDRANFLPKAAARS